MGSISVRNVSQHIFFLIFLYSTQTIKVQEPRPCGSDMAVPVLPKYLLGVILSSLE